MFGFVIFAVLAASEPSDFNFESEGMKIKAELVLEGLDIPWGLAFSSPFEMFVTEKSGKLSVYNLKTKITKNIEGLPKVFVGGQGGLLDLELAPDFEKSRWIYFSYAHQVEPGKATTRIARAKWVESSEALTELQVLFTADPASSEGRHFGSRIVFDKEGFLYFSVGDRGNRKFAQDLTRHNGKIFRLKPDGQVPKDNPFVKPPNARPEIWSYGHRNPQGLFIHPETNDLWEHEHGPRGGDEINWIRKGLNYGWPEVTYGKEYWGPKIGETAKEGMEQPIHHYTPSIAPCGFVIYSGKHFEKWKGDFLIGSLVLKHLNRVVIKGRKFIKEERLLENRDERIREVVESPDGLVYFSTDSGKVFRLQKL